MIATDVMTVPVYIVAPNETVAYARNLMVKHHISRVLVMDGEKLVGILTKKDIAYRLRQGGAAWRRHPLDRIPVSEIAVADPLVVAPTIATRTIAELFVKKNISSVPVVDGGKVVGIVTKSDLMKSALVGSLQCPVRDVMEDVATVSRYHSLDHVIDVMSERNDKVVVTNNDGTIAGIITETNLAFFSNQQVISHGAEKDVTKNRRPKGSTNRETGSRVIALVIAEDVMTSPVITVSPGMLLSEAIALMNRHHINSVVVVENGDISGIVKRDDIIKEVTQ